jgi:hypothetical protein
LRPGAGHGPVFRSRVLLLAGPPNTTLPLRGARPSLCLSPNYLAGGPGPSGPWHNHRLGRKPKIGHVVDACNPELYIWCLVLCQSPDKSRKGSGHDDAQELSSAPGKETSWRDRTRKLPSPHPDHGQCVGGRLLFGLLLGMRASGAEAGGRLGGEGSIRRVLPSPSQLVVL